MRLHFFPPKVITATVIGFSTALVLTSCSGNGDADNDEDPRVPQEDVDRLNSELSEANVLAEDLSMVSNRITQQCMEDQGFSIHPSSAAVSTEDDDADDDFGGVIIALPGSEVVGQDLLPETDVAATEGAGIGDRWIERQTDDAESDSSGSAEWENTDEEYQAEYNETRYELDFTDVSDLDENEITEYSSDDLHQTAKGCQGLTTHLIYGPDAAGLAGLSPDELHSFAILPLPGNLDEHTWPWDIDFYTSELQDTKHEWNACLDDRGTTTVSALGGVFDYVYSFYEDPSDQEHGPDPADQDGYMEPPEEAPWEFDEANEQEIDYITDLAECADDTDLREARQDAWDQTLAAMFLEHEDAMYLWEEDINDALEEAQRVLEE